MSASLPCPKCGDMRSLTKDSRAYRNGIKRRRTCYGCGFRYLTIETAVMVPFKGSSRRALYRAIQKSVTAQTALLALLGEPPEEATPEPENRS